MVLSVLFPVACLPLLSACSSNPPPEVVEKVVFRVPEIPVELTTCADLPPALKDTDLNPVDPNWVSISTYVYRTHLAFKSCKDTNRLLVVWYTKQKATIEKKVEEGR